MNVMNFVRQYADKIGGQFTVYDQNKAVVVVPLPEGRFQTVLALARKGPNSGREQVVFISKICEFDASIDTKELLSENMNFDYGKFILDDGFLKIEASCSIASANEEQVKEMIQEIAHLADQFELRYTGADIH